MCHDQYILSEPSFHTSNTLCTMGNFHILKIDRWVISVSHFFIIKYSNSFTSTKNHPIGVMRLQNSTNLNLIQRNKLKTISNLPIILSLN